MTRSRVLPALAAVLLVLIPAHALRAQEVKGRLLIIGGGGRTEAIIDRFIELAGGKEKARIIVLPHASGVPDTSGMEQVAEFKEHGAKNVEWVLFTREQTGNPAILEKFIGATGVFFTGGDQVRVTKAMLATPVHEKLKSLYRSGSVIGGTSAGAAIMSKVMLTGEELINKRPTNAFGSIMKGNVETIEGLGFLENVIIDQHFVKRSRLNRLISVVLEHPALPGIGIDESTAVQVNPDGTFEVLGIGSVVVFDARNADAIRTDKGGSFGVHGLTTHIYNVGDVFTLQFGAPKAPAGR